VQHQFSVRRRGIKVIGGRSITSSVDGEILLEAKKKALKFRERVEFSEGERPLFSVVLAAGDPDWGTTYRITREDGVHLGYMKRRALSALSRDEWWCYGPDNQLRATLKEEKSWLGVLRRSIGIFAIFAPRRYEAKIGDSLEGTIHGSRNFLAPHYTCQVSQGLVDSVGWEMMYTIPNLLLLLRNKPRPDNASE